MRDNPIMGQRMLSGAVFFRRLGKTLLSILSEMIVGTRVLTTEDFFFFNNLQIYLFIDLCIFII